MKYTSHCDGMAAQGRLRSQLAVASISFAGVAAPAGAAMEDSGIIEGGEFSYTRCPTQVGARRSDTEGSNTTHWDVTAEVFDDEPNARAGSGARREPFA